MNSRLYRVLRQYAKFCLIGFTNLGVDLCIYWALTRHIAFFDNLQIAAHVISFSIAVTNSYIWNTIWVFKAGRAHSRRKEATRFGKFLVVNVIGLLISSMTFLFLTTPQWLLPAFIARNHASGLAHFLDHILTAHPLFPPRMPFQLGPLWMKGDIVAKLVTAVVVSLWNFPVNKLWTFRRP